MRTDSSPPRPAGAPRSVDAAQARDAGLRLTRRVQGWIAAVAVAMAGALAAFTAHAYHARAAAATVTTAPSVRPPAEGNSASGSTTPASSIQPPAAVPVPAPSTSVAPVVSGGS